MTVIEFARSFLGLGCKPKKDYWLVVYKQGARIDDKKQILANAPIGCCELYAGLEAKNSEVKVWFIQGRNIIVIIKNIEEQ